MSELARDPEDPFALLVLLRVAPPEVHRVFYVSEMEQLRKPGRFRSERHNE